MNPGTADPLPKCGKGILNILGGMLWMFIDPFFPLVRFFFPEPHRVPTSIEFGQIPSAHGPCTLVEGDLSPLHPVSLSFHVQTLTRPLPLVAKEPSGFLSPSHDAFYSFAVGPAFFENSKIMGFPFGNGGRSFSVKCGSFMPLLSTM